MTGLLEEYHLAKWPIITVCPYYYSPHPNYEFYKGYRDQINKMKKVLGVSPHSDNGAF